MNIENDSGVIRDGHRSFEDRGYFGKSSKRREFEPTMFKLLTWETSESQVISKKTNERIMKKDQIVQQNVCQTDFTQGSSKKILKHNSKSPNQNSTNKTSQEQLKGITSPSSNKNMKKYVKNQKENRPHSSYKHESRNLLQKSNQSRNQGEQQNEQQTKLIEQFRQTTRWLPNSAFTTYFGKPAFENYGRGNVTPTNGGMLYGDYLKSHNVQPHRGSNSPQNLESYYCALNKAQISGTITPQPPKTKSIQNEKVNICSPKSKIYPQSNIMEPLDIVAPNLYELEKFGASENKKKKTIK